MTTITTLLGECRPVTIGRSRWLMRFRVLWVSQLNVAVVVILAGCGPTTPEWMVPPAIHPSSIVQDIMAQADADKNGTLEGNELAAIPGLQGSLTPLDTNADTKLSRQEIKSWLDQVKADAAPQVEASFKIVAGGKSVPDALVRLVPEACMGGAIEAAEGKTDESGIVFLNIPTMRTLGVRCGLYRLEITGKLPDGKAVPAKYGQNSPLGYAVGGSLPNDWTPEIVAD